MDDANKGALESELVEALCANGKSPLIPRQELFFEFDYPGAAPRQQSPGQRCLRPGAAYLFRSTDRNSLQDQLERLRKQQNDELAPSFSEEFASIPLWRMIVAGLPGGGKTRGADVLQAKLLTEQIAELTKDLPRWRLPLRISAEDALNKGLPSAIIESLQETYSSNVSYPLFRAAYRCGYYVLIIDDIGLWADPGERLTVSNRLLSELLSTAGESGQFICTIDSRFLYKSTAARIHAGLGERFELGNDIRLLDLTESRSTFPKLGDIDTFSVVDRAVTEFVDGPDPAGIFGPGSRRAIVKEMAWQTYRTSGHSVALADLNDMVWRALPSAVQESSFRTKACEIVLTHQLFCGSEVRGFRFSSQLVYEGVLAASVAESILDGKTRDVLISLLAKEDFHERLALMVLCHPKLESRRDAFAAECAWLLEDFPARIPGGLSEQQRTNAAMALITIIAVHHRLSPGADKWVKMPANVNLKGATLVERLFDGMDLRRWNFDGAILTGTTFRNCRLTDCTYRGADAPTIVFDGIEAAGLIDLTGARLAGGRFANVSPAEPMLFSRADLTAASFAGDCWQGALANKFHDAILAASEGLPDHAVSRRTETLDLTALKLPGTGHQRLAWFEGVVARLVNERDVEVSYSADPGLRPITVGVTTEFQPLTSLRALGLLAGKAAFLARGDKRSVILRWNDGAVQSVPLPVGQDLVAVTDHGEALFGGASGLELRKWDTDRLVPAGLLSGAAVDVLLATPQGAVACFGNRLVDFRRHERGEWKAWSEIALHGTPTLIANHDFTSVAAFADESVMLLSRRFGWAVRARHQLGFASIGALAIVPSQFLIFVFGNKAERLPCTTICLIDGRTGQLLLYFDHSSVPNAEQVMERQMRATRAEIRLAENPHEGIIDPSGTIVLRLLHGIKPHLPATTYEQASQSEVVVTLMAAPEVARRLFVRYRNASGGADLPLTVEFAIERPHGDRVLVPFDNTSLEELPGGAISARFETEFQNQGDHRLTGSIFLAGYQADIELPQPLAVRKRNPFVTQLPLIGETLFLFKGHERMLRHCLDFIDNGSMMVCGSRRMGKSSFLNYLATKFREQRRDVTTVLVSCDAVTKERADLSYFEHLFQQLSHDEWARRITGVQPDKTTFNNMNEVKTALGAVKDNMSRVVGEHAKLVVLADEINALLENAGMEALDRISEVLTNNGWIRQVATGLPNIKGLESTASSGIIRYLGRPSFLQPLSPREIEKLVTEPLLGRFSISAKVLARVVRYSSGRPHDAQNLIYEAVALAIGDERREILDEDVDHSLRRLVKFFESYQHPFIQLEEEQPEVAASWRSQCHADFDDFYDHLNRLGKTDTGFGPFLKWGYVRGELGEEYNVPYALLLAWAKPLDKIGELHGTSASRRDR